MEQDDIQLCEAIEGLSNEADKLLNYINNIKRKGTNIARRAEAVLTPEIKQKVKEKAVRDILSLKERLLEINLDLELDDEESSNSLIPYLPVGENFHNLKFLTGDSPWNFWLYDDKLDTKSLHKILLKKYQNDLLEPNPTPKPSDSVCFLDRNKIFRGIVLQIVNENRVKLFDCDSNVSKIVASDKIFKVDADACYVHASAMRCTIPKEPGEPDSAGLWSLELRDIFCNTLREAILHVKIVERLEGCFPIFVVDVQLQSEDEAGSASLTEWIATRLIPELRKLTTDKDESVCDFLSQDSLNPYFKGCIHDDEVSPPKTHRPNSILSSNENKGLRKVINGELNNLNYHMNKVSEKVVTNVEQSVKENLIIEDIENELEQTKVSSSEEGIVSSSSSGSELMSSGKESYENDCISKNETTPDSRLKSSSEEFRPKKSSVIPRFNKAKQQNRNNVAVQPPQYIHPQPSPYPGFAVTCPVTFIPQPQMHQWPYGHHPLNQVNNNWSHPQISSMNNSWSGQDSSFVPVNSKCDSSVKISNVNRNEHVNVMAPEFVPRNNNMSQTSTSGLTDVENSNQVPTARGKEEINLIELRKPRSLINPGENLLVLISHVESPAEFYVHFVTSNNKYQDKLVEDMMTYYTTKKKVVFDTLKEARKHLGKFCACKWLEDNHWYRVEVLDWALGNNEVKVFFVDYGNTECVPLHCLQPLRLQFAKLSMCAQACHLAKVHPVLKGQPWSQESIAFFKSKVDLGHSHIFSVTVVPSKEKHIKANSLSVLLYEGKATDDSTSINDILVDFGMAWSKRLSRPLASSDSDVYQSLDELSLSGDLIGDTKATPPPAVTHSPQIPAASDNDPVLVEDLERWDPRADDFESARNNPLIDTDDALVAVTGYSARDEARICKFFASDGHCWKEYCTKEHSMPNKDGTTTDKEEVYCPAFTELELPLPGDVVKVKVTAVSSINLFYVQVEEKKGRLLDPGEDGEVTLSILEEFMNKQENIQEMKHLKIPPALGQLVLARDGDFWYRARVISTDDSPEVMYVDYGSICTVSETDLRQMEPRYLHLPFQAIECSLANVIPLELDNEKYEEATDLLRQSIECQVLSARIYESGEGDEVHRLQVLLQLDNGTDVGEWLVESNICEPRL